ncbi:single-stranded DNA-binding protein [Phenylobacterium soli]|uniref:Single-stranded DNA-binding protein n=1 Tax=Phenylobacterium soli TaxID=2170551 RepID=A0A328AL93_9CAUL|nr:single-stranded DNA-binding protein [Phenylobacterium soli]RAK55610.1 single-stranded DNA-binding protein [Phenylobacterium soli]
MTANRVTLIGRLGTNPEFRTTNNGAKVATFRIATEERWKKDGERKSRTTWHTVETFMQGTVKFLEAYVQKGDLVEVTGILRYDEFEKGGVKQSRAKIAMSGPQHQLTVLQGSRSNGASQPDEPADRDFQPEIDEPVC